MKDLEIPHARLARWLDGVRDRHGELTVAGEVVRAADGTVAVLRSWYPLDGVDSMAELVRTAAPPASIGLVLLRRGGYAVVLDVDGEASARKVGRRHVQSRTAAGGWSQQRFARRRGKQADELVVAVADHVHRLLAPEPPDGVLVGGDRALVRELWRDARLRELAARPRRELWDVPDPAAAVVERARARARCVQVRITEPEPTGGAGVDDPSQSSPRSAS